jgi:2-(1,2-epoxy-1,2-dihydrophenyl)acetyl-CoA isomerase
LLFPRTITAQDAYDLGIANRLVPVGELHAEAEKVARQLADGPTVAYAALKEAVAYGLTHTLEETLEKEDELQSRAGASEDHAIAVQAFVNKEKPKYLGR